MFFQVHRNTVIVEKYLVKFPGVLPFLQFPDSETGKRMHHCTADKKECDHFFPERVDIFVHFISLPDNFFFADLPDDRGITRHYLHQSVLDHIRITGELAESAADADYIIEAAPEVLELKQELLLQIDRTAPPDAVIGTNTSSLKLTDIICRLPKERRRKCLVCHWYNPAHLIPMVELSFFGNMSEEDYQDVADLYEQCGKVPVKVLKDIPGMIANRLLHAQAREVFYLDSIGAASKEDLDKALMFGPCFRNATTGMFECADMGGLDIWMAGENNFFPYLDNSKEANPVMQEHVAKGELGVKTGKGYYDYTGDQGSQIEKAFERRLIRQMKASREYTG